MIDVEEVCTEQQLDEALGNQLTSQTGLQPTGWTDCEPARQGALDRVMRALARRSPPIVDSDLANVTELRQVVIYGAAEHIYRLAVTRANEADVWFAQWKIYERLFGDELKALSPTLQGGYRGTSFSFGVERR